ncbi:hypothetical protein CYMTET_27103, partial [Cymbomonas tetramitiformis]
MSHNSFEFHGAYSISATFVALCFLSAFDAAVLLPGTHAGNHTETSDNSAAHFRGSLNSSTRSLLQDSEEFQQIKEFLANYLISSAVSEDYGPRLLQEIVSVQRNPATLFDVEAKLQRRSGSLDVPEALQVTVVHTELGENYVLFLNGITPTGAVILESAAGGQQLQAATSARRRSVLQTDGAIACIPIASNIEVQYIK